ncbi:U1 small nuclear ribonucleoprotein C-1-like [Penaeus monodon]|uniref:U1 small nuclear ribonucleoprotein C-1-like n=1 Tax=Penaeus monodon TaxID=6687 RepID=UPI0018A79A8E|nr:U1 small nuclear ribonucleoprotein C-1-like [Penaeus monodon]
MVCPGIGSIDEETRSSSRSPRKNPPACPPGSSPGYLGGSSSGRSSEDSSGGSPAGSPPGRSSAANPWHVPGEAVLCPVLAGSFRDVPAAALPDIPEAAPPQSKPPNPGGPQNYAQMAFRAVLHPRFSLILGR